MPGLPLPHRSLRKDQKKVIYDTFKSFDKSAYKVYAVALIFANEGRGALETLRRWRGALVFARERASQTDSLSFLNLGYNGSTMGVVQIGLELSSDTSMGPGVPGTHPNNLRSSVLLSDLESNVFIQFYDDDEATKMIKRFESVLEAHVRKVRKPGPEGNCIELTSFNDFNSSRQLSSISRSSSTDSSSSPYIHLPSRGGGDPGGRQSRQQRSVPDPSATIEALVCDIKKLSLGAGSTMNGSDDNRQVKSHSSSKLSSTSESRPRSMKHVASGLPARSGSITSREIKLRDHIIYVRDLTSVLKWSDNKIGSGGFGQVWKGRLADEDRRVAIKMVNLKYHEPRAVAHSKRFQNEAGIWSLLQHKNVLEFLGIADSPTMPACLVSPLMEKGNVRSYLAHNPRTPRLPLGTADGIAYLHSQSVIHGDLKGANILVSDKREALLCDFGIASLALDTRDSGTDSSTVIRAGSFQWMAKELLLTDKPGLEISEASDVWAFAMVVIEILTTRNPFPDLHTFVAILSVVIKGKRPKRPDMQECCDGLWNLLNQCWKDEPSDRPTTVKVLREVDRLAQSQGAF